MAPSCRDATLVALALSFLPSLSVANIFFDTDDYLLECTGRKLMSASSLKRHMLKIRCSGRKGCFAASTSLGLHKFKECS